MKLNYMRLLLLIGFLLPLTVFCQKRDYKKGLAFEKEGEVLLAIDHYKQALYKNMYYSGAKAGLKRCAEARMESLLSEYFMARQKGDWKEAAKIFETVETLTDEMAYFSIEIDLPAYQEARFAADRQKIQEKSEALSASGRQEEMEKKAFIAFENGNYFLAYDLYSSLLASEPENKDYARYLDQSKAKGRMSMAVADLQDQNSRHTEALKTAMLSAIAQWSHPLLTMIEREDLNALIREQKRVFTGLFEESSTASPGMLKGVKHLLIVRLEDVRYKRNTGKPIGQTAYEKVRSKVFDEAGNWRINERYLPRDFFEKSDHASMTASLHYKLLEVETGKILTANKVLGTVEDEKVVSTYNGNTGTLFPVRNGEIVITGEYVNEFRASFGPQKALKSETRLFHELEQQLAAAAIAHLKEFLLGVSL